MTTRRSIKDPVAAWQGDADDTPIQTWPNSCVQVEQRSQIAAVRDIAVGENSRKAVKMLAVAALGHVAQGLATGLPALVPNTATRYGIGPDAAGSLRTSTIAFTVGD